MAIHAVNPSFSDTISHTNTTRTKDLENDGSGEQDLEKTLEDFKANDIQIQTIDALVLKKDHNDHSKPSQLQNKTEQLPSKSQIDQKSVNTPTNNIETIINLSSSTSVNINITTASTNISISFESSIRLQVSIEGATAVEPKKQDPLVLDLNNNGFKTSGIENGVLFDINGDGVKERVSTSIADPYLAIDLNNNGLIDNGTELFGDQNGSTNGFSELAKYDNNGDGKIDNLDPVFNKLKLYYLSANNQSTQNLTDSNVKAIYLSSTQNNSRLKDAYLTDTSKVELTNNQTTLAGDLLLSYAKVG